MVCLSFATIVLITVLLELVDADNWIVTLLYYGYHLFLIAGIAYLYRPRGFAADKYFRQDESDEGNRDEIDLDDISGFDVNSTEGTHPWDGSSALPLEPVVRGRSGHSQSRKPTALTQPLTQDTNYT
jgi:hypothetical protein